MSSKISIKKNFIMNSILTMSNFIFPFITFPYIARILGPAGSGKVQLALSVVTYFSMFAELGIPSYGIRACARVRDNKKELSKVVHELLIINLLLCLVVYAVFFLCVAFIPMMNREKNLYLIVSLTILLNAVGIEWMYRALEQYTYITLRSVIFKAVSIAFMFLLIHQQSDYIIYGAISIFAASASNILNFINARKYIFMKKCHGYNFKRHFKVVVVFFAMACATTVYTNLDTVMLGIMKTDADVGYYNAAVKIKVVLLGLVTSLGAVLLPRASYYIEKGMKEEFLNVSEKAIKFVLFLAAPITIYFILFAKEGIYFLSGNQYKPSIVPMQIIMPTVLLIGISNLTGLQVLVPEGKEKYVLYSEIAGAVTDLVLNIILIPKYSAAGAATGTLIAEMVVLAVQFFFVSDDIRKIFTKILYWKNILALVISSIFSVWVKILPLSNIINTLEYRCFIKLVFSFIIFFGIYILILKYLKDETVEYILTEIRNKAGIKKNKSI